MKIKIAILFLNNSSIWRDLVTDIVSCNVCFVLGIIVFKASCLLSFFFASAECKDILGTTLQVRTHMLRFSTGFDK